MMKKCLIALAAVLPCLLLAAIDEATAVRMAMAHAGVTTVGVNSCYAELDEDDGQLVYEIHFKDATTAYEYEVAAENSAILKSKQKKLRQPIAQPVAQPAPVAQQPVALPQPKPANVDIGAEKAKALALADAALKSAPRRLKVKRDYEDGRQVYEVEFKAGRMEYDYTIDAFSGAILKRDVERDDDLF